MADLSKQPTTGFVNNGSLVQYGNDNTAGDWDYIVISKSDRPWRVSIRGDIPAGKDGVDMSVSVFEGTIPLFSSTGTWNLQGQTSLNSAKKNFKIKFKNAETGKKLKVKIGDWAPMNGLVLKGYGTDRTLLRDIVTTEIWRNFHRDEAGLLAPASAYSYYDRDNLGMRTSVLFSTAGFPCELYHDGEFLGMYIIRSDNDNDQYLIDSSNPRHFLAQPDHASTFWTDGNYNPQEWEIYSPDPNTDDSVSFLKRFLRWSSDCIAGRVSMKETYREYIDLECFIDYILLCEVCFSPDSLVNNFMLCSWNATPASGVTYIYPYDEDQTFGIVDQYLSADDSDPFRIGWITKRDRMIDGQDPVFFETIHNCFTPEIRARWRYLRDTGKISYETFSKIIKDKSDLINPDMIKKDLDLWIMNAEVGLGNGKVISDDGKKWSVNFILNFAKRRIQWLDQQFKYYN